MIVSTEVVTKPITPPSIAKSFNVTTTIPPISQATLGETIIFKGNGFMGSMPEKLLLGPILLDVHVLDDSTAWAKMPDTLNTTKPANVSNFDAVDFILQNLPRDATSEDRALVESMITPEAIDLLVHVLYGGSSNGSSTNAAAPSSGSTGSGSASSSGNGNSGSSSSSGSGSGGTSGGGSTSGSSSSGGGSSSGSGGSTSGSGSSGDSDGSSSTSGDDSGVATGDAEVLIEPIFRTDSATTGGSPLPFSGFGIDLEGTGTIVASPQVSLHSFGCLDSSLNTYFGAKQHNATTADSTAGGSLSVGDFVFKKFGSKFSPGYMAMRFISEGPALVNLSTDVQVSVSPDSDGSYQVTNPGVAHVDYSVETGVSIGMFALDLKEALPPTSTTKITFKIRFDIPRLFFVREWRVTMVYRPVPLTMEMTYLSPYAATIQMSVAEPLRHVRGANVSIVIYRPLIPTKLVAGNATLCPANPDGSSLTCNLGFLTSTTINPITIDFTFSVTVPSYHVRDITVLVSFSGLNIASTTGLIRFLKSKDSFSQKPNSNESVWDIPQVDGDDDRKDGLGPNAAPQNSGGASPDNQNDDPDNPNSAALVSTPAPTAVPTPQPPANALAGGVDTVRGIFDPTRCVGYFHFIIYAILGYLIVLLVRYVVDKIRIRNNGGAEEHKKTIETVKVEPWRVAVHRHVWVGVVVPSHSFCGSTHVHVFFAHFALFLAVSTALIEHVNVPITSSGGRATFIAIFAALVSSITTPILNYYYMLEKVVDKRHEADRVNKYLIGDIEGEENHHLPGVGVSSKTLHQLDSAGAESTAATAVADQAPSVDTVPLDVTTLDSLPEVESDDDNDSSGTLSGENTSANTESSGDHHTQQQLPRGGIATSPTKTIDVGDQRDASGHQRRFPKTMKIYLSEYVLIDTRSSTRTANIVAVLMFAVSLFITYINSAHWCVDKINLFYNVCLLALPLDILLAQTIYAALTYLYAWVISDEEVDEIEVEEEAKKAKQQQQQQQQQIAPTAVSGENPAPAQAQHQQTQQDKLLLRYFDGYSFYPIDSQYRHVGPLYSKHEMGDDPQL